MPEQSRDAPLPHRPESTYIHQLNVLGGRVRVVGPVGDVRHVVPLRPQTLPQPVVELFPLLPGYGKGNIDFFSIIYIS